MNSFRSGNAGIGAFVLEHRRSIGASLLLITAFMACNAMRVGAATRFEDLFAAAHPDVQLYQSVPAAWRTRIRSTKVCAPPAA